MAVAGGYADVVDQSEESGHFLVIDVSGPQTLAVVGSLIMPGRAEWVAVCGSFVGVDVHLPMEM